MSIFRIRSWIAVAAALHLAAGAARGVGDSYASGFFTRGVDAAAYLDFLKSDKAAPFFTEQGFTILK